MPMICEERENDAFPFPWSEKSRIGLFARLPMTGMFLALDLEIRQILNLAGCPSPCSGLARRKGKPVVALSMIARSPDGRLGDAATPRKGFYSAPSLSRRLALRACRDRAPSGSTTLGRGIFLLAFLTAAVPALAGCGGAFEGEVLAALPVAAEPTEADWERAVPLDLSVWMGNVHERPEVVALDRETSHRSTAQCHHGADNSRPVPVRLMALYSPSDLFLRVKWADPTPDRDLGTWIFEGGKWARSPAADDGVAFLWGPPEEGRIRCQESCHMREVDVYDGGTQMRMAMARSGPGILDLWRWRSAVTGPFGLADDMMVDSEGKRGDEGQVQPVPLRQEDLGPGIEAREIPAFLAEPVSGRQAQVAAAGSWSAGHWQVTFRRALNTGDTADLPFEPGRSYPFGMSVFDSTWLEHHVSDRGMELRLIISEPSGTDSRRSIDEAMDF